MKLFSCSGSVRIVVRKPPRAPAHPETLRPIVWNDFRSRELSRGKLGDPTEFDALFKLSGPMELDALVEISAPGLWVAWLLFSSWKSPVY
jgi:hypothetical protein